MLGVRLTDQLDQRLTQLAEKTQRSKSYHTKEALRAYIDNEELKVRENEIAQQRWEAYEATGESVDHALMERWLNSWGSDQELPCPVK